MNGVKSGKKRKVKDVVEERVVGAPVTPPAEVDEDEDEEGGSTKKSKGKEKATGTGQGSAKELVEERRIPAKWVCLHDSPQPYAECPQSSKLFCEVS